MTKQVSSINQTLRHPEGWTFIRSGLEGGFYWLLYARGDRLRRVIYNQQGREVFCEEWQGVAVRVSRWQKAKRIFREALGWSDRQR